MPEQFSPPRPQGPPLLWQRFEPREEHRLRRCACACRAHGRVWNQEHAHHRQTVHRVAQPSERGESAPFLPARREPLQNWPVLSDLEICVVQALLGTSCLGRLSRGACSVASAGAAAGSDSACGVSVPSGGSADVVARAGGGGVEIRAL